MYVPTHFAVTDQTRLHDFIEAHSFGLLVSTVEGVPFATHLPFLLERNTGPHGCLIAHVARGNPQWHDLEGRPVLAIFSGPHAYISPSWYEANNVVPTWNYTAVHVYGTCNLVQDPVELAGILAAMVNTFERGQPRPWTLDTSSDYFGRMVRGIVGFRIAIDRLEGKWKLNQNHPAERREKVIRILAASTDPQAQEVARLMMEMRE
jgi:transcriptional regulator